MRQILNLARSHRKSLEPPRRTPAPAENALPSRAVARAGDILNQVRACRDRKRSSHDEGAERRLASRGVTGVSGERVELGVARLPA
jgi:hypothetical protein